MSVRRISIAEIMQWRRESGFKPDDWIQADLDKAVAEQTAQGAKRLDEAWAEYNKGYSLDVDEEYESHCLDCGTVGLHACQTNGEY